ncbi:hypothetical protein [Alkalihalobacterium alkalinitrilicum]|uniref:hypothetical protein n=1 Tax=Alkalihalobacterium alkalinitrilicum TaxID=427920 RepID=UPI0009954212|nr:hypothetical protein [Alkalihalobacterium alkalinitrilicum]
MEILKTLVEKSHYYKYGDIYSKHRLRITNVLTYLFSHYIKKPLKIDEEGVLYLHQLAKQHLNFELSKTVRSIEARIRDVESLILVDRATFQYFDRENFDPAIMSKIESYIDDQFKQKKEIINVEEVYEKFQDRLVHLNIHNKIHLYSLIRFYLDEKYTIGQGNTLNIYKNKKSRQSVEERLVAYMKKHGGICSKEQLLEVVSPLFKVDLAINSSDKIISWGSKNAILVNKLNIKANEKAVLLEFIDQSFKNGYATANSMYKEMMFNRKLSSIVRDKNIDDASKLPAIIKLLKPTVKGHTNYLYVDGFELDSFEKLIEAHFTGETSRQEIKEFIYEHGYKEMMVTNFLKRVLDNEVFIEIDIDQLYPAKLLKVNEAELSEIETYVREKIGDGEYLSLSHLKGYRRKLPDIGFRWNPHLLQSVLQRCGFRQIKKTFNDYRYDKVIVVREESSIQSFEDLILNVLENEYEGNLHEIAIYEFLMEKGIVREQEYMHKKVLPYEIKTSERLHFDELGIVTVKKG